MVQRSKFKSVRNELWKSKKEGLTMKSKMKIQMEDDLDYENSEKV